MGIFKEFKEFAVKGNMVDIAIGVIIGAAFQKVIDVLVKQVMMPPLTLLTDGVNFANKQIVLREGYTAADGTTVEAVSIGYGELIVLFAGNGLRGSNLNLLRFLLCMFSNGGGYLLCQLSGLAQCFGFA